MHDETAERTISIFSDEDAAIADGLTAVLAPDGDAVGGDPDKGNSGVTARPTDKALEAFSEGRRVRGQRLTLTEDEADSDAGKRLLNRAQSRCGPLLIGVYEKPKPIFIPRDRRKEAFEVIRHDRVFPSDVTRAPFVGAP